MQGLQKKGTAEGVVWLTLISSAPGIRAISRPRRPRSWKTERGAASTDVLLDPKGKVGRAYGAQTTPHMFVIDKAGTLVYMGGIDDQPLRDRPT